MPKVHSTCIYSKKSKKLIVNLHMLKKIKKNKNLRLYVGVTGVDDLVFLFFCFFFEYMQVL